MGKGKSANSKRKDRDRVKPRMASSALNYLLLILTAIIGTIACFVGNIVYLALPITFPMPLLMGILFAILAVLTVFTVLLISKITGAYERNLFTGRVTDGIAGYLVVGMVSIFAMAVLFQWLYGLNFKKSIEEPTSYIFIIDDSGSMTTNDPNNQRFSAIGTLLEFKDQDFQYAIYTFADNVTLARGMTKVSDGTSSTASHSEGGTYMGEALIRVIDDINNGVIDGGTNPKVILLTDGQASDIRPFENIKKYTDGYCDEGIIISTIGLGSANRLQLKSIAEKTGGVFVSIDDTAQLSNALAEAALGNDSRNLLSARAQMPNSWLYGIMRIVFLTLLATAIGICAAFAYGIKDSFNIIVMVSAIKALLAALIVEIGTAHVGDMGFISVLIASILTATTVALRFFRDFDDANNNGRFTTAVLSNDNMTECKSQKRIG